MNLSTYTVLTMALAMNSFADTTLAMNSFADTMLRQRVVEQIDAAWEGVELEPGINSSEEVENVLYAKAKTREEYMQLIASLVLHLNEKERAALRNKASQGTTQQAAESEVATNS